MATIGRTALRFSGALLLGAIAASVDGPRLLLAPSPMAPVVVATRDISRGATIDRQSVGVVSWPIGRIPAGAFTSIDSLAGRVTRVPIFKGEALVLGRLVPAAAHPAIDVQIAPGKRALAFRCNDASGIAGRIQPNSRVDVLLITSGEKGQTTKLVMENMRVLAIGTIAQRTEDGRQINAAVCTVEVTPDEGERLAIATTQGAIQLMPRSYTKPDSIPFRRRARLRRPDGVKVPVIGDSNDSDPFDRA